VGVHGARADPEEVGDLLVAQRRRSGQGSSIRGGRAGAAGAAEPRGGRRVGGPRSGQRSRIFRTCWRRAVAESILPSCRSVRARAVSTSTISSRIVRAAQSGTPRVEVLARAVTPTHAFPRLRRPTRALATATSSRIHLHCDASRPEPPSNRDTDRSRVSSSAPAPPMLIARRPGRRRPWDGFRTAPERRRPARR
jgi:hypothetical protein